MPSEKYYRRNNPTNLYYKKKQLLIIVLFKCTTKGNVCMFVAIIDLKTKIQNFRFPSIKIFK